MTWYSRTWQIDSLLGSPGQVEAEEYHEATPRTELVTVVSLEEAQREIDRLLQVLRLNAGGKGN